MEFTIFYAWQKQSPNSTNRGFIEKELEAVAKEFQNDDVVVVIDRDTAGVPGAPDIGQTILDKIGTCDLFVGDVSIVNPNATDERQTPNGNVLVEVGYGLGTIGPKRVLLVMNTAYGTPEALPFDLRQKRAMTYELKEDEPKDVARLALRAQLRGRIGEALKAHQVVLSAPTPPARDRAADAVNAIRSGLPSQDEEGRRLVEALAEDLDKIDPHKLAGDQEENLIAAIEKTRPVVDDFGRAAEAAAAMRSSDAVRGLVEGLEHVLVRYYLRQIDGSVAVKNSDFDLFKFVGHELGVVLGAHLLRARRWELFAMICREKMIQSRDPRSEPRTVSIGALSRPVELLNQRSARLGRASVQSDLYAMRHAGATPVGKVQLDDFLGADFLLFAGTFVPGAFGHWFARAAPAMVDRTPRVLQQATTLDGAKNLATAIGQPDLTAMKAQIKSVIEPIMSSFRSSMVYWDFNPELIATK